MAHHLIETFARSIAADVIQRALGLLNSILLMRYLGVSTTGEYLMMIAILSIGPTVLNSLDQAITRFLGGSEPDDRVRLALGVFVYKFYAILAIGLVAYFAVQAFPDTPSVRSLLAAENRTLLWGMSFSFVVIPLVSGWVNRVLAVYERFVTVMLVDLLQALATTAWIALVFIGFGLIGLQYVVIGMCLVLAAGTAVKLWHLHRVEPHWARMLPRFLGAPRTWFGSVFSRSRLQYFAPFLLTSVSGYLKDFFPVLIVGAVSTTQSVAEFRVIQQIFRVAHSIVPNAFELVRPVLLKQYTSGQPEFAKRYHKYAQIYIVGIALCCLLVIAALPLAVTLWGVTLSQTLLFVSVVFALELLFGAATHVEYQIFLLSEKTGYLAFMSLTRQVGTALATVLAGMTWGPAGVACGAAVGALYAWLGFAAYTYKTSMRPAIHLRHTVVLVCSLSLLICSPLVASSFIVRAGSGLALKLPGVSVPQQSPEA